MNQLSSLTIDDFSGGFTDNYLGGPMNKYERADNFFITSNKKLRGRDGSVIIDGTNYQLPDGAVRLGTLISFDKSDTLFWHYARKLYYGTSITHLTGPTGNEAFDLFTTSDYLNYSQWQKQLFMVPSSGTLSNACYPVRAYKDGSGTWQLRTAGLPRLAGSALNYVGATALASLITLANDMRTKMLDHYSAGVADTVARLNAAKVVMNAHLNDAVIHPTPDHLNLIVAADATNAATAVVLANALQACWNAHQTDANRTSTWAFHVAQYDLTGFNILRTMSITGIGECKDYLNYLYTYFNGHDNARAASGAAHHLGPTHLIAAQTSQYVYHESEDTAAEAILTSAAATDLPTLLVLVNQMIRAYRIHNADAVKSFPTVHRFPWPFPGLAYSSYNPESDFDADNEDSPLSYTDLATDLESIAEKLNELRLRWNVHAGKAHYHAGFYDSTNIVSTLPVEGVNHGPYIATDHTAMYRMANELKDKFVSHMSRQAASGQPHEANTNNSDSGVSYSPAPAAATTPVTLADAVLALRGMYFEHLVQRHSGYHYGSTPLNTNLPETSVIYIFGSYSSLADNYSSATPYLYNRQIEYLNELQTKFPLHMAELTPHNNDVSAVADDTPRGDELSLGSYVWALHYEYAYTVGSVDFLDRGPLLLIEADQIIAIENQAAVITAIPVLTNTGGQNYDTTNLKIKIARTPKNGTAFYYCGEVLNGTTTFTDSMIDADLLLQEPLYTEGGVVENDPPPMAKAFHIVENTGYYGNLVVQNESSTEFLPNRVVQSINGDPDSVPATFYVDLDYPVTLISSAKSKPVVVTNTKTYRLDGAFDERGQGEIIPEKIGDVGSECPQSAVQAEEGVFFLATDGVYFTDGYKVMRVNDDWTATYKGFVSSQTKRDRIQGTYDEVNKFIYWTIQATGANSENDSILMLDLRWGIRSDSTFLTWSNGDDFRPTALCIFNKQLLRGDSRGYVLKHGSTYTSDPKINTGANPSTWAKKAITWDYISGGADFGNAKARKFIPSMAVTARNLGNLSLQVVSYNDDQTSGKSCAPIRYRTQYTGMIQEERMMPAGGLRCSFKQLQLTNANVIITNSDLHGPASVNRGAHTVTLDSAVTEDWPADAIDWQIYFEYKNLGAGNVLDNYATGYPVTIRTADTLTFTDATPTAPSGSVKWILKGTPKDEQFELHALNVSVMMTAEGQNTYMNNETGANA